MQKSDQISAIKLSIEIMNGCVIQPANFTKWLAIFYLVCSCFQYLLWYFESIFVDSFYDRFKGDFRGKGVSMVDHWFFIWAIPTVHCKNYQKLWFFPNDRLYYKCDFRASLSIWQYSEEQGMYSYLIIIYCKFRN